MRLNLKILSFAGASALSVSMPARTGRAETPASSDAPPLSAARVQLGLFGGVLFQPARSTLREPGSPALDFEQAALEVGVRAGIYPVRYLGAELEGAYAPTGTEDGRGAQLFALRAHAVAQLPTRGITPFILGGYGRFFATSRSLGDDDDRAGHFGAGVKMPMGERVSVRVDVRDTIVDDAAHAARHYPELLFGLGVGLGGPSSPRPTSPAPDGDGDGVADAEDACPREAGTRPDGCPVRDTDGDGVTDDADRCPTVSGIAPDGCPDPDPDRDGVPVDADRCPTVPGIAPDGCPDPDPDKDGVLVDADRCPGQPETVNGFEDEDGCPDELPEQVKRFMGVIEGIEFDFGKATIRKGSYAALDAAVQVLKEHPTLRIRITGHTDSVGSREANLERSAERAAAVKEYLVQQGIDPAHLETAGAGPDSPVADNATEAGRQKNRRIEFEILQ